MSVATRPVQVSHLADSIWENIFDSQTQSMQMLYLESQILSVARNL